MRYLYSALFYLLTPFIALRMLLRSRHAPAYRARIAERLGFFKADLQCRASSTIWLHAVSVGEVLAAAPIIENLLQRYPDRCLVVTTTTPTGSDRVQALFGSRVFHVYSPWDTPGAVKRFLRKIRPQLLLIMETELWPNMLYHAHHSGCRVVLANARLSQHSADGYARFGGLAAGMMTQLDMVACQGRADGERFLALGLEEEKLELTGSIKFDLELNSEIRDAAFALGEQWGVKKRSIIVAASTHTGEDEIILEAFVAVRRAFDNCLLVIVPRHPERFETVYELCAAQGWSTVRRSYGGAVALQTDVIVGDSMGELLPMLGCASVAIIGGSFISCGGHNALEASAWGVPVITGPSMFNFAEVSELLITAGAMIQVSGSGELADTLVNILSHADKRGAMGMAGEQVVAQNKGAKKRLLNLIDCQLAGSI